MENHRSNKRVSVETIANTNGLIKNLNLDITQSILSHIPIEFVSRSRAVCKLWRTLLRKPKIGFLFAVSESKQEIQLFHGYSDQASIDDAPISYRILPKIDFGLGTSGNVPVKLIRNDPNNPVIFGSCNGLVCLPVRKDDAQFLVYICNPMTGEYVYLPEMDFGEISRSEVFGGFGYCQSTNEYKVVQVAYRYSRFKELGRVQVYTLGDGSGWRNKGEIRYTKKERLVHANDAFYWPERIENDWKINVFDLANETFVEKYVEDEEYLSVRQVDKRLDMWILKKQKQKKNKVAGYSPVDEKDDSNRWVWIKQFSMEFKTDFDECIDYEPFAITDNNQVLMWEEVESYFGICKYPICYDRDTANRNELWNEGLTYAQAIPHMNSFVSLKDLGEKSARYIPDSKELMHLSHKL